MARAGMNLKTLQYLMGHSGISVTMNTYTHLGLEDAENELRRLSEINSARLELDRLNGTDFSIESNVKFGIGQKIDWTNVTERIMQIRKTREADAIVQMLPGAFVVSGIMVN